jgi:hypothetical protein
MPLWPEQAPCEVFASENVPSLHSKVEPFGGFAVAVFDVAAGLLAAVFTALFAAFAALAAMLDIVLAVVWAELAAALAAFATAFIALATALLAFELLVALFVAPPPQAARARDAPKASVSKNPVFIIFPRRGHRFASLHRSIFISF